MDSAEKPNQVENAAKVGVMQLVVAVVQISIPDPLVEALARFAIQGPKGVVVDVVNRSVARAVEQLSAEMHARGLLR